MGNKKVGDFLGDFQRFLDTKKGQNWEMDRKKRADLFQEKFSEKHIDSLTEKELEEVIKTLWATQFWTNKNYIFNKIVSENGFNNIREAFKELFYGKGKIEERFDAFRDRIKHIGPSMLTEIMTFVDPKNYCIWNDKPINTLPYLELEKDLPERVFKYPIDGGNYEKCLKAMGGVRKKIRTVIEDPDFIDVDFFLAYLFYEAKEYLKEEKKVAEATTSIESHSDAQGMLLKLGGLLEYDTFVPKEDRSRKFQGEKLGDIATLKKMLPFSYEKIIDTASHIDVIWFKEEFPSACFEVEETTDVTKGLNRLGDLEELVDNMFIVGNKEKEKKFQKDIGRPVFRSIKDRTNFLDYETMEEFYKTAKKFTKMKREILVVK